MQNEEIIHELYKEFGEEVSSRALKEYNPKYYALATEGLLKRSSERSWAIPSEQVTVPTVNMYQEIKKRFSMLDILGDGVVEGNMKALIVAGSAGVGKTYELEKKFSVAECDGKINSFTHVKGSISPIILYETMFMNKDEGNIIMLDDADRIYEDEESLNLLKAALDTSVERKVCWMKKSSYLEEAGIPNWFLYEGQIVFITNKNLDKIIAKAGKMAPHMEALISRGVFLDLCIHENKEIMMRVHQVVEESSLIDDLGLTGTQARGILDWMESRLTTLRSVSIRTVIQIASFVKTTDNWGDIAEATLVKHNFY